MPLFSENDLLGNTGFNSEAPETPAAPEESSFVDTAVSAFKLENTVANVLRTYDPNANRNLDPKFDPIAKLEADYPDMTQHASRFAKTLNEDDFNRTVSNITWEQEQRDIVERGPGLASLAGGMLGGIVDPLLFVPVIGAASKASTVGRTAAIVAANAAGGTAAQEIILQGSQELRTAQESAINVVGAAALGGLLGAGIAAVSRSSRELASQSFVKSALGEDLAVDMDEVKRIMTTPKEEVPVGGGSLSAAEAPSSKEDLGLANINETVAKVLGGDVLGLGDFLAPPDLRAAVSPSESARKLGEVFYNSSYLRNKNLDGVATKQNAQNAIFRQDMQVQQNVNLIDELYYQHTGKGQIGSAVALPEGKLKFNDFSSQVWNKLVDPDNAAVVPEAEKAAKIIRSDMDKISARLVKEGVLEEGIDPEFMRTYMSRVWDTDKLANPVVANRLVNKIAAFLEKNNYDGTPRMKNVDGQMVEDLLPIDNAIESATKFLESIKGESEQQIAMSMMAEDFISKGKFTKERVLQVPDTEIAEFLRTDGIQNYRNYMMRATRLLETQGALKRAGFENIQEVLSKLIDEKNAAVRGLTDSPEDMAKALKIGQEFDKEAKLVKNMYRSMMGQMFKPGAASRALSHLRKYQTARLLGGVTISSLPDIAAVPFRMGLGKTLRDGWLPMVRSLKTWKASASQLDDISGALEFEQNNILRALSGEDDLAEIGKNRNFFDKSMDVMSEGFTKASGIGYWTGLQRRIAAQVSSADTMRTIVNGPKGKDVTRLASLGINKSDYKAIAAQIEKHAQQINGTFLMNGHLWDDAAALDKLKNAIQINVESSILRPGGESLPFAVQSSDIGKILFQFKSFSSAATGKILISGLQRRDASAALGFTYLVAMGALTGVIKAKIAGREPNEDIDALILDGISRSGVGGLVATTALDLGRGFTGEYATRFGDDALLGAIMGPSAGLIQDTAKVITTTIKEAQEGEEDKAYDKAAKMLPFQNLFYLKRLMQEAFGEEE